MHLIKCIFTLLITAVIFSSAGFAQSKDKNAPLPDNATLADSQEYLIKMLNKNFGYSTIDDSVKMSDLKFDGCRISYRAIQRYTDQKAALGDRPALGNTGATASKEITYNVHEDVNFDLKDINPAQISLSALGRPKSMQLIELETVGKKDLIKFDRTGTNVRYNTSGVRAVNGFPVKASAGEQIAKAFMHVIRLCQAETK
jgi:hypothetical protein